MRTATARTAIGGVKYSIGIDEIGTLLKPDRTSPGDRAEYPISNNVIAVIRTNPSSIRLW